MITGTKEQPACDGIDCSLKDKCLRYKDNISKLEEYHFPLAPIRYIEGVPVCKFIIPIVHPNK